MTILNRYILKKFIRPFLASFFALCLLVFVAQLFDRLDRFLAEGVGIKVVLGYLLTSMPFQALQVLPVACLLATLFVVGNLARTREYIAGLAGGLAPEKFLAGLFLAGFAISLIGWAANETIIPPATRYSRTVYQEKIRHLGEWRQSVFNDLFVAGNEGRMWAVHRFTPSSGAMERVIVDTYRDGHFGPQIDAKTAQWTSADGWTFYNGEERIFQSDGMGVEAVVPFKEKKTTFTEKPDDLVFQEPQPEEMTYKQLKRHLSHLESLGVPVRQLQVELMMKLAFPFSCFVVTMLGVPLAFQGKGSPAMGIAAGGILTLIYMGFIQFGKALAQHVLAPWLGAWLGNIFFIIIGAYLWLRMRRAA